MSVVLAQSMLQFGDIYVNHIKKLICINLIVQISIVQSTYVFQMYELDWQDKNPLQDTLIF